MKRVLREHWFCFLLLVFLVLVLIPLIVVALVSCHLIVTDTTNNWIGFWGSYFGAIIGSLTTIGGVYFTINNEREKQKEDERKKEKEIKEKKRTDVIPFLGSLYYIPKEMKAFDGKMVRFVEFFGKQDFTQRSYVPSKYIDSAGEKLKYDVDQLYILNYCVTNVGVGSAVSLNIIINGQNVVWNEALGTGVELIVCLVFKIKEIENTIIDIQLDYDDVVGIGQYRQREKYQFKVKQDAEKGTISLEKLSKDSKPTLRNQEKQENKIKMSNEKN